MIGAALGGVVKKAETGWCIGVHEFEILKHEPRMIPWLQNANLLIMCQDQVVELPPDTTILALEIIRPNRTDWVKEPANHEHDKDKNIQSDCIKGLDWLKLRRRPVIRLVWVIRLIVPFRPLLKVSKNNIQ